MTKRLTKIFEQLPTCNTFADVGCDHGYLAKAMIQSGKCKRVIISDISAPCLQKAKDLLSEELQSGVATAVVSNGFQNVPPCDLALIAGMGGEEIASILQDAVELPNALVLQPMKNSPKVRSLLISLGYAIKKDFTFKCGKIFYDLIVCEKGKDFLTEEEVEFGRTNIKEKPSDFVDYLKLKIKNLISFSQSENLGENTRTEMKKQVERLKKYVDVK